MENYMENEKKNKVTQSARCLLVASNQEQAAILLTAEKTDPRIMMMLAGSIVKVFEEVYASTMPLRNLAECLRIFYNIRDTHKSDATMRKLIQAIINNSDIDIEDEDIEEMDVASCTVEEMVQDMKIEEAKVMLGVIYPSVKSYLNGQDGWLNEDDLKEDDDVEEE
ncbi:hypothetical protein [Limosilactobacillus mucosae]|uniref:hypothetical protein n=1 Tax=Limosilactobacillus mucosae TaxID=97478 RepID=UPI0039950E7A